MAVNIKSECVANRLRARVTDLRAQLQSTLGDAYTLERELGGGGMSRVRFACSVHSGSLRSGRTCRVSRTDEY